MRVKSPGSMALPEAINSDGTKVFFNTWLLCKGVPTNLLRPFTYNRTTHTIREIIPNFSGYTPAPKERVLPKRTNCKKKPRHI